MKPPWESGQHPVSIRPPSAEKLLKTTISAKIPRIAQQSFNNEPKWHFQPSPACLQGKIPSNRSTIPQQSLNNASTIPKIPRIPQQSFNNDPKMTFSTVSRLFRGKDSLNRPSTILQWSQKSQESLNNPSITTQNDIFNHLLSIHRERIPQHSQKSLNSTRESFNNPENPSPILQ